MASDKYNVRGFAWGNVNERGELEEEYLDQTTKAFVTSNAAEKYIGLDELRYDKGVLTLPILATVNGSDLLQHTTLLEMLSQSSAAVKDAVDELQSHRKRIDALLDAVKKVKEIKAQLSSGEVRPQPTLDEAEWFLNDRSEESMMQLDQALKRLEAARRALEEHAQELAKSAPPRPTFELGKPTKRGVVGALETPPTAPAAPGEGDTAAAPPTTAAAAETSQTAATTDFQGFDERLFYPIHLDDWEREIVYEEGDARTLEDVRMGDSDSETGVRMAESEHGEDEEERPNGRPQANGASTDAATDGHVYTRGARAGPGPSSLRLRGTNGHPSSSGAPPPARFWVNASSVEEGFGLRPAARVVRPYDDLSLYAESEDEEDEEMRFLTGGRRGIPPAAAAALKKKQAAAAAAKRPADMQRLVPFELPLGAAPKPVDEDTPLVVEDEEGRPRDSRVELIQRLTDPSRVVLKERLGLSLPAALQSRSSGAANPLLRNPEWLLQRIPLSVEEADRLDTRPVLDLTDPSLMFRASKGIEALQPGTLAGLRATLRLRDDTKGDVRTLGSHLLQEERSLMLNPGDVLQKRARDVQGPEQLCYHSLPALSMQSLQYDLPAEELLRFHRPRAVFIGGGKIVKTAKKVAGITLTLGKGSKNTKPSNPNTSFHLYNFRGNKVTALPFVLAQTTPVAHLVDMIRQSGVVVEQPGLPFTSYTLRVLTGKMYTDAQQTPSALLRTESFIIQNGQPSELNEQGEAVPMPDSRAIKDLDLFYHQSPRKEREFPDEVHLWVVPCNIFYPRVAPQLPDPEKVPVRPPGAFKEMDAITADDMTSRSHVILVEHLEEDPPLLSEKGMGMRLVTYYRKQHERDQRHMDLPGNYADSRWKLGKLQVLENNEPSPLLANLLPGVPQLTVDTSMYRAPAFAYEPAPSDFLLIRKPNGTLIIREIDGTVLSAQQEPRVKVPAPFSAELYAVEKRMIIDIACRRMRRLKHDLDSAREAAGDDEEAITREKMRVIQPLNAGLRKGKDEFLYITAHEVMDKLVGHAFRSQRSEQLRLRTSYPERYYSNFVHKTLTDSGLFQEIVISKDRPKNVIPDLPFYETSRYYTLSPTATLPEEEALRRSFTPDMLCALHSSRAYHRKLDRMGIGFNEKELFKAHSQWDADLVKLAIEQLSDEHRRVGYALDLALEAAPWRTTTNFVEAVRELKGPGLMITGVGDPTSRRLGYSYIRKIERLEVASVGIRKVGTLHKTDADLRRMSIEKAHKILIEDFKMDPALVSKMGRWDAIGVIQKLSTAAASEGVHMEHVMLFGRARKLRPEQVLQQMRLQCHDIFDAVVKEFTAPSLSAQPQTQYALVERAALGPGAAGGGDEDAFDFAATLEEALDRAQTMREDARKREEARLAREREEEEEGLQHFETEVLGVRNEKKEQEEERNRAPDAPEGAAEAKRLRRKILLRKPPPAPGQPGEWDVIREVYYTELWKMDALKRMAAEYSRDKTEDGAVVIKGKGKSDLQMDRPVTGGRGRGRGGRGGGRGRGGSSGPKPISVIASGPRIKREGGRGRGRGGGRRSRYEEDDEEEDEWHSEEEEDEEEEADYEDDDEDAPRRTRPSVKSKKISTPLDELNSAMSRFITGKLRSNGEIFGKDPVGDVSASAFIKPITDDIREDYLTRVNRNDLMCMDFMATKLKLRCYKSTDDLLADFQQMANNAKAYHTPGVVAGGLNTKFCTPYLIPRAERLRDIAAEMIQNQWARFEPLNRAVRDYLSANPDALERIPKLSGWDLLNATYKKSEKDKLHLGVGVSLDIGAIVASTVGGAGQGSRKKGGMFTGNVPVPGGPPIPSAYTDEDFDGRAPAPQQPVVNDEWVACDKCMKWRLISEPWTEGKDWFCHEHQRSCEEICDNCKKPQCECEDVGGGGGGDDEEEGQQLEPSPPPEPKQKKASQGVRRPREEDTGPDFVNPNDMTAEERKELFGSEDEDEQEEEEEEDFRLGEDSEDEDFDLSNRRHNQRRRAGGLVGQKRSARGSERTQRASARAKRPRRMDDFVAGDDEGDSEDGEQYSEYSD